MGLGAGGDRSFQVRPSNDGVTLATALRKFLGEDVSWSEIKRLVSSRRVHLNGNLCVDEARRVQAGDTVHLFAESRAPLPTEQDIVIRHLDQHVVVIEKPAGLNTLRHREETDIPQQRKDKAPTVDELLQRLVNEKFRAGHFRENAGRAVGGGGVRGGGGAGRAGGAGGAGGSGAADGRRSAVPPAHPLFGRPGGEKGEGTRKGSGPASAGRRESVGRAKPGGGGFHGGRGKHDRGGSPESSRAPGDGGRGGGLQAAPVLRPVHRLDRETSGLMLFALSAPAEQALERDFARHVVERKYMAIVHGHVAAARTIETYLVRDRGDGIRGSSPKGSGAADAQRAVTHVTPIEKIKDFSVVECQLETGRTHQIRIHLSEIGHPLAGEKTYVTPAIAAASIPGPARHALHSHHLQFTHPITGAVLRFSSPLPKDLANWLKKLRAEAGK